jgi:LPXTG-motif cell wall-anchored protein
MVLPSMRRTGHRIACLLAAGALMLPAAAQGQSAGDEEYQDPFGGDAQEQPEPTPAPEPAASDDGAPQSAQTAPAPTATTAQSVPAAQEQLPRTGADEGLVALAGGVLLASGLALRRRTG